MATWACLLALCACGTAAAVAPLEDQFGTALATSGALARKHLNERPIIGILTQGGDPAPAGHTYIAASYVKFIEAAGARAAPVPAGAPRAELARLFGALNGLLIPGGGQPLSPGHAFYDAAAALLDLAAAANDAGDAFPVHGTCLGFEAMAVWAARGNASVLSAFDSWDNAATLDFVPGAEARSALAAALPPAARAGLAAQRWAMENHSEGVAPEEFEPEAGAGAGAGPGAARARARVGDVFDVVTTSADRRGARYVSTMEARRYPFTGTQWHPEKNAYEWAPFLHIPHAPGAVEAAAAVAAHLVAGARRSAHAPASRRDEDAMLIYNWAPAFTGRGRGRGGGESDFVQSYLFRDDDWPWARRAAALGRRGGARKAWAL